MEKSGAGVRKGAWTKEEDILLSKCIEKYGEGKWHLVPPRAGLNRCRKSCRLRWLNYLRPNIKRGYFSKDEVDLIVRLHKLLGNRWSLIAGRLPGRTANDVKNFWNTHIQKKLSTKESNNENENVQKTITKSNIVRPQPRTFSKSHVIKPNQTNDHENKQLSLSASSSQDDLDECIKWWSNLLEATEVGEEITPLPFSNEDQQIEHDGLNSLDIDMEFDRFIYQSFNPFD